MRLDSSGNLGIGTSSPATRLEIRNDTSNAARVRVTSSATTADEYRGYEFGNGSIFKGGLLQDQSTDLISIFTPVGGQSFRLDTNGNLGLGVTPSAGWNSGKAIELGQVQGNAIWGLGINSLYLTSNARWDGSNYRYTNNGAANVYGVGTGNGTFTWFNAPSGTAGNAITFTQAMTLDASGNLGIGTSSPAFKLDVQAAECTTNVKSTTGTNFVYQRFENTGGNLYAGIERSTGGFLGPTGAYEAFFVYGGTGGMALGSGGNGYVRFLTNNTERARIDSSGNLLWAKTAPLETTNGIQFAFDGTNVSRLSIGGANSSSATSLSVYSTTASAFRFFVSYAGQINATSTSITAISDQSLKENIRDLDTGLSEVMALRPRRFDWKEETQLPDKNVAGFIAQEVEQVLPELVYDYMYSEGVTKKSLKMGDILPTLVKAIQEQQAIIESLKARLDAANL
jgi:hypothetical protein